MTASENHVSSVYPVVVECGWNEMPCSTRHGGRGSYSSATLLNRLETRDRRRETRCIEMMLKTVTCEVELSTVNVQLLDGQFNMDVSAAKVNKTELLYVGDPH